MLDQVPSPPQTLPNIAAVLRRALGAALDPEASGFLDMCAEDVVLEFPFAPPGAPTRVEGRAALQAYLAQIGSMIDLKEMTVPTVHASTETGTFVIEFSAAATSRINGRDLTQTYIVVIRTADGRMTHYRDYWNPLVGIAAMEPAND